MCGIYGLLDFNLQSTPSDVLLSRMGNSIFHRGPDDSGQYLAPGIGLGMRRLSIIDLSGGHQPISNEDGSIWVICNGEIYNFLELRKNLEKNGHVFRTLSDTEVLVHLYEQDGPEFLVKLRGMFAIALWDARLGRLILARDRLGKKPLYVHRDAQRLLFASEMKAILEDPSVSRRVDEEALEEYLALGYVPAPRTLLRGIEKVLPGHYWLVERGKIQDREYWDARFDQIEDCSEEEWIERIQDKLLESVKIRLVSDVPLGAFLSGGIDSSAIVAAMARLTDQPVKTYSIGFEGEDKYYNELPYAQTVAKAFRTDHHEIIVRPEVASLLPKLIWHLDEPIADSASVTTYLVSELARQSVTVILSGVGGDELFGGYRRYLGENLQRKYGLLPDVVGQKWLPALLSRLPQDRHSGWKNQVRYASAFVQSATSDSAARYTSFITVFDSDMRARLLRRATTNGGKSSADSSQVLARYFKRAVGADSLHQAIYVDLKTSLPDDLLALTDRMTMASSIECRAPFMDHELVELAGRMPSNLKVRGLTMKYVLKKALRSWLPRDILHRKKRGFGAPMGSWLRRRLDPLVQDVLSEDQVRKRGFFDWTVVHEILTSHRAQTRDYTDHLLALISFELWCRIFLDGEDWRSEAERVAAKEHAV
jgi:asparagine synthase (glutamine-hydrolysing)